MRFMTKVFGIIASVSMVCVYILAQNITPSSVSVGGSTTAHTGNFGALRGMGNQPSCTVGAAAGTGATCSLSTGSTNVSGQLTVTTGTTTVASDILTTNVSFSAVQASTTYLYGYTCI
jgi:hypothetical protein